MSGRWILLAVVAASCKKDAAAPPVPATGETPPGETGPDKPALVYVAPAGEGGEEDIPVAIDRTGIVLFASRLREAQEVEGVGRPARTKKNRDALYVAARDIKARKAWVQTATADISYPRASAMALLGDGRVALATEHTKVLDWGKGPIDVRLPDRHAGKLEQFKAASDRIADLGFGLYVVGQPPADVTVVRAMRGEITHVVSDGAGAIVAAGRGWHDELAAPWKKVDCGEQRSDTIIARWRDAGTPDWAACQRQPTETRIGALAVASDGDVIVCIDVARKKDEDDPESEETWQAHLVRLDGATGKKRWTVPLPDRETGSSCGGLATTAGGHVVLAQDTVEGLVVFSGKDAPKLDAPSKIRASTFARGLQPTTIVVARGGAVSEVDVVTGALLWSYELPPVNVGVLAAGAAMVAISGSYDKAFDGGPAGKLPAVGDLDGYVMVVRAPIAPK
jgi:hypothetical protein